MEKNMKQVFLLVCSCALLGCTSSVKNNPEINSDTFLLTGHIEGYKPAAEPLIGKIYYEELFTGKPLVKVTEVASDGYFQASIPLGHSQEMNLNVGSRYYTLYALPKGKLHLTLNPDYPDSCEYKGDGADISKELNFYYGFRRTHYSNDFSGMQSDMERLSPNDFKVKREKVLAERLRTIDSLQTTRNLSQDIADLIRYHEQLYNGHILLSFADFRRHLGRAKPDNQILQQPTPPDYYTFLQDMPFEKKDAVSLSQYRDMIGSIRFAPPIMDAGNSVKDTIITVKYTFLTYLLDKNVPLTDEERKIAEGHRYFIGTHKANPAFLKAFNEKLDRSVYSPFEEKYKVWCDSFNVKLQKDVDAGNSVLSVHISSVENDLESLTKRWEKCNDTFKKMYPQTPSLAFDIFALQYFIGQLKGIASPADADTLYNQRISFITDNTIKEVMREKYQKRFSSSDLLQQTKGGEIVRRLIAPHKGKYVLLDFWGTTCGPCRGDIDQFSELRKSYTGSPDFAYLFITSSQNSPEKDYRKYIAEHLKGEESYFLSDYEYAYLEELFAMNGIPRYVLINPEGEILDDEYDIYQLEKFLNEKGIRKGASVFKTFF